MTDPPAPIIDTRDAGLGEAAGPGEHPVTGTPAPNLATRAAGFATILAGRETHP